MAVEFKTRDAAESTDIEAVRLVQQLGGWVTGRKQAGHGITFTVDTEERLPGNAATSTDSTSEKLFTGLRASPLVIEVRYL